MLTLISMALPQDSIQLRCCVLRATFVTRLSPLLPTNIFLISLMSCFNSSNASLQWTSYRLQKLFDLLSSFIKNSPQNTTFHTNPTLYLGTSCESGFASPVPLVTSGFLPSSAATLCLHSCSFAFAISASMHR